MPQANQPEPQPTQGGSYQRDPVTGDLTPLQQPKPAPLGLAADPLAAGQPAGAATTTDEA